MLLCPPNSQARTCSPCIPPSLHAGERNGPMPVSPTTTIPELSCVLVGSRGGRWCLGKAVGMAQAFSRLGCWQICSACQWGTRWDKPVSFFFRLWFAPQPEGLFLCKECAEGEHSPIQSAPDQVAELSLEEPSSSTRTAQDRGESHKLPHPLLHVQTFTPGTSRRTGLTGGSCPPSSSAL